MAGKEARSVKQQDRRRIMSAAFSTAGAFVLPPIRVGITEALTTRSPSPWNFSAESTTAVPQASAAARESAVMCWNSSSRALTETPLPGAFQRPVHGVSPLSPLLVAQRRAIADFPAGARGRETGRWGRDSGPTHGHKRDCH